jgi:hypothetical protein
VGCSFSKMHGECLAGMFGAVGGRVVGHVVAEDDEAASGYFDCNGFVLLRPRLK